MSAYREAVQVLLCGGDLGAPLASSVMREMLDGACTPAQVGSLLASLARRVETVDEFVGFAEVMRERAVPISTTGDPIDTCGTGGSGLPTTNTSTAAAFVLAAGGVSVAKHGNRASSGICGGMDVLEHLGVAIELDPSAATALLAEHGLVFLFAPRYHPALRAVGAIRRELGFRTIFNFLGPLCNPARVTRQVLGVSDVQRAPRMAAALSRLGSRHVLVASGADGLDELSLTGTTRIWEVRDGWVREMSVHPDEFGLTLAVPEEIAGGDRYRNAELLVDVLSGRNSGPHARHVALNAGAGFFVAGKTVSLADGVTLATTILSSGAAYDLFERYRQATQQFLQAA
jgi:anthranilate phosphoribosyltransferase